LNNLLEKDSLPIACQEDSKITIDFFSCRCRKHDYICWCYRFNHETHVWPVLRHKVI